MFVQTAWSRERSRRWSEVKEAKEVSRSPLSFTIYSTDSLDYRIQSKITLLYFSTSSSTVKPSPLRYEILQHESSTTSRWTRASFKSMLQI